MSTNNIISVTGVKIPKKVDKKIKEFLEGFNVVELSSNGNIFLYRDECSKGIYTVIHLYAEEVINKTDIDAVLDPNESEDYKLNRGIYVDNYAFKKMEEDAVNGRSFEDIVVEYDTSYKRKKPLKVFGGQHRIEAIKSAFQKGVNKAHGFRVYFSLNVDQRFDIAITNNTAIAVSNDLLDRMQEKTLGPELMAWAQKVGILNEGQDFADKRNAKGIPTIRVARAFIVNFLLGLESNLNDFHEPIVTKSGTGIDDDYLNIRSSINWENEELNKAGEEFARLHKTQRERILSGEGKKFVEFPNKVIHPSIAAGWAYAAGLLQEDAKKLEKLYSLPESTDGDPLNAEALLKAHLKGTDRDTYRGVGSRISKDEIGRVLQVFLLYVEKGPSITERLANVAIRIYEARKSSYEAEKAKAKL